MNCQVGIEEMNGNEPLMRCRKPYILSKPSFELRLRISFDVNWHNRQRGSRHRGGMNSIQALTRNMRTCRSDDKGEAYVVNPRGESTNAEHRGGSTRSSD
jgi:hypothetical protein